MLRKLPHFERVRRVARLAEQPAAWAHYLVGRRRKRVGAVVVPPPVFDPGTIASLRLWLRGDDIGASDASPVSLWPDASGYGNDVEQITGMKQPTFYDEGLNGHSYVGFDGIDDTLFKAAASGFTCTTGHTVIAVMNPTTAVAYGMGIVTNYQCNEMRQNGTGGTPQWMIPSGFYQVNGLSDVSGSWKVWSGTFNVGTGDIELFINGVTQGTENDGSALAVGDIYLGSRTDTYHWIGDIAEVLVFDDVLGAGERGNVESHLMSKYAIA